MLYLLLPRGLQEGHSSEIQEDAILLLDAMGEVP